MNAGILLYVLVTSGLFEYKIKTKLTTRLLQSKSNQNKIEHR